MSVGEQIILPRLRRSILTRLVFIRKSIIDRQIFTQVADLSIKWEERLPGLFRISDVIFISLVFHKTF